ncbi:hypothetical protein GF378_02275 [Candidatus Pacearchaeota archaeon]|nr:hypothetical protein [Candidatus Pacearchaeota archaeon]
MEKTYFEKFLEKPYWYRAVTYLIFVILVWIIADWKNTKTLNLSILYIDYPLTFVFIGFALLLAFATKSIYKSIFGRTVNIK